MTRLARLYLRLFGTLNVSVWGLDDEMMHGHDNETLLCWHTRGVLHCVELWYHGKHDPRWTLHRTHIPLSSIEYWTKARI